MGNYTVGDKFVIKINEVFKTTADGVTGTLYRVFGFNSLVFDERGLDRLEKLDSDYVNEHFGELQDEAYNEGEKAGFERAFKWEKDNQIDMYNQGLNDIWKLLDKTEEMSDDDYYACFGVKVHDGITKISPQEALAKLEAYKKEQDEIKVGDVVKTKNDEEFVVSYIYENHGFKSYCGITNKGQWIGGASASDVEKTGKHIDIQSILNQLGGGGNGQ